jgi:hypothetical protein
VNIKALAFVLLAYATVFVGCKALSGWWSEPLAPGQPIVQPVGPDGSGGTVAVQPPPSAPSEPTVVEVPNVGTVTVQPAPPPATKGGAVVSVASGVAGAYLGPLGALLINLLGGALGMAASKKQKTA